MGLRYSWDGRLLRCRGFLGRLAVQDRHPRARLQLILPIDDDLVGLSPESVSAWPSLI
jgi:hypothetical protein